MSFSIINLQPVSTFHSLTVLRGGDKNQRRKRSTSKSYLSASSRARDKDFVHLNDGLDVRVVRYIALEGRRMRQKSRHKVFDGIKQKVAHRHECRICSRLNAPDSALDRNSLESGMSAQELNRQRHMRIDVITHIEPRAFIVRIENTDFRHRYSVGGLNGSSNWKCFLNGQSAPEQVPEGLLHHLAAHFGYGIGQRDFLGADLNAVLRVAAFLDSAIAHQRGETFPLQRFSRGMSIEQLYLRNRRRADEARVFVELRACLHTAAAGNAIG